MYILSFEKMEKVLCMLFVKLNTPQIEAEWVLRKVQQF